MVTNYCYDQTGCSSEGIYKVKQFTEKPDIDTAKKWHASISLEQWDIHMETFCK